MTENPQLPVVIYDGECNLCASVVSFVLPRDREARLRFAARQSAAGQRLLQTVGCPAADATSVVLVESGRCWMRSDAVLRIVRILPFPWPILGVLHLVPRPLRDAIYDRVARNRERWFGRRTACLLTAPGWEDRFQV